MKNYIGFLNDYSGSMSNLSRAAVSDYNANVVAVKDAATKNMQDTIVSMFGFGGIVRREIVNSNPHVLKPLERWTASGGTPLYTAILDMINLFKSMPDYSDQKVSFLILVTTDGEATDYNNEGAAREALAALSRDERWTFVFRVPRGARSSLRGLNIHEGNIQEWDTTTAGMAQSTAATTQAFEQFYATRATGVRGSNTFYANAAGVDAKAVAATLKDISGDVSLYVVPVEANGIEIRPFILTKRMEYLKGSAFYQLTKTEARVSETKLIAIRNRTDGKIYSGIEARKLIGMPTSGNARLHPGDHGNFDIFIQSESTNRKLVGGTGVLYWKAIGKPFTAADEAYLQPKPVVPAAPAVVVLPQVTPTNRPTPSSIPVAKKLPSAPTPIAPTDGGRVRYYAPCYGALFYNTREMARAQALVQGKRAYDAGPSAPRTQRHYVA
jgi:hypothetical protein